MGRPTRLTHHGFIVDGPRSIATAASCIPLRTRTRSRRSIASRPPEALRGDWPRGMAASRSAISDDAVYFDQLEVRHNVALSADVYRFDRAHGGGPAPDARRAAHGRRRVARRQARGRRSHPAAARGPAWCIDRAQLDAGRAAAVASRGDRGQAPDVVCRRAAMVAGRPVHRGRATRRGAARRRSCSSTRTRWASNGAWRRRRPGGT